MSIKRTVVKVKGGLRRRKQRKSDKRVRELTLAKNKALREAEMATREAKAKGELSQARAKRDEAQGKVKGSKKRRKARAKKTLASISKGGKSLISFLNKHTKPLDTGLK